VRALRAPFAAGAAAAFGSTLAASRLIARDRPLLPIALYRIGLAAAVLQRVKRPARLRGTAK
jgi:hypothetical protein